MIAPLKLLAVAMLALFCAAPALAQTPGDDIIAGSANDDANSGEAGDDILVGNDGLDTLDGATGDDVLQGGRDNDRLDGGDGADLLIGGDGADRLSGGPGEDRLFVGDGGDAIQGDGGDDWIVAGDGDDTLRGGAGEDFLDAGDGDDRLDGGAGADTLLGGTGADTFVISAPGAQVRILDFRAAAGDRIDLSTLEGVAPGHVALVAAFAARRTPEAVLDLAPGVATLRIDLNGDGAADAQAAIEYGRTPPAATDLVR